MKITNFVNLVCVAIIAWHVGARSQRKKDLNEIQETITEFKETHEKGFPIRPSGKSRQGFIFKTRFDADEVFSRMKDLIDDYGMVTVGDLYASVGLSLDYVDGLYGWKDLKDASINWVHGGYLLSLPPSILL